MTAVLEFQSRRRADDSRIVAPWRGRNVPTGREGETRSPVAPTTTGTGAAYGDVGRESGSPYP